MPASKDPTGASAPSGGFQDLGWYSGYQYYQGSFAPKAGVIHPSSPQVGAGQAVSEEVNRAGSIAAGLAPSAYQDYLSGGYPTSKEKVTPYLNKMQDSYFGSFQGAPEIKVPTMEELRGQLSPTTAYPETLDRTKMFEDLRTKHGVSDLEQQLTDLKAQEDELYASFRTQKYTEEGKPVALNVMAGRIGEEERQYLERVDYLGRQVARITDELNTKYNIISTYINLEGLDYQDAVTRYQTEFNNNLKLYDIITGKEAAARSAYESDRAAASANLQIYYNAITKGNIDYSSLGADQKVMVSKLEAQAGLPIGFMSNLKKDPDADIVFTTSNEGVTQVGLRNADGTISVESYGTRISGAGGSADEKRKAIFDEVQTELDKLGGKDKYVSPDEWNYLRQQWMSFGYSDKDFDAAFRQTYVGDPETRGWTSRAFGFEPYKSEEDKQITY